MEHEYRDNAARVGAYFANKLRALKDRYAEIGDIRGKGLMLGMELVTDAQTKTPATRLCDAVIDRAYRRGLILLSCGASTVRFMPPLLIQEADVDEAMHLLDQALADALARAGSPAARGVA